MSTTDHYVYILFRENGVPFYVGKGQRNRWLEHERRCNNPRERDSHKNRIVRNMKDRGVVVPKKKIAVGMINEDALALEIATIARIGREPHGPLVNQTAGGEGLRELSIEVRRRIGEKVRASLLGKPGRSKGVPRSEEAKQKTSATLKGRPRPDAAIWMKGRQHGKAQKGVPKTPEHRAAMSAAAKKRHEEGRNSHLMFGHRVPDEVKAKISASLSNRNKTAEQRAKVAAALKGKPFSEEHKANLRVARQARAARVRLARADILNS